MGTHGPPPPEPHWDRMDMRGINSTRHAWGYLSPDDSVLVKDDGSVYVRIDRNHLTIDKKNRKYLLKILGSLAARVQRALRWSKIIQQLYDFNDGTESGPASLSKDNANLTLRRKPSTVGNSEHQL